MAAARASIAWARGQGGPGTRGGLAVSLAEQPVRLRGKFLSPAVMLWFRPLMLHSPPPPGSDSHIERTPGDPHGGVPATATGQESCFMPRGPASIKGAARAPDAGKALLELRISLVRSPKALRMPVGRTATRYTHTKHCGVSNEISNASLEL